MSVRLNDFILSWLLHSSFMFSAIFATFSGSPWTIDCCINRYLDSECIDEVCKLSNRINSAVFFFFISLKVNYWRSGLLWRIDWKMRIPLFWSLIFIFFKTEIFLFWKRANFHSRKKNPTTKNHKNMISFWFQNFKKGPEQKSYLLIQF